MNAFQRELRRLAPAWAICTLAPLVLMVARLPWDGPSDVLGFLIAAICLAVYAFHGGSAPLGEFVLRDAAATVGDAWRNRMLALGLALLAMVLVYALGRATLFDSYNDVRSLQALASLLPALCVAPYTVLLTRKPFAAVVFTLALVGCTKLLAGAVTCSVYGWDATTQGRTTMPWDRPDLMVWVFWLNNLLLAATCYVLGYRQFRRMPVVCDETGPAVASP